MGDADGIPVDHLANLRSEGIKLADTVEGVALDTPVPSCPPWAVRDLLGHLGYVHRWAAAYVAGPLRTEVDRSSEPELLRDKPGDAGLLEWFRDGHSSLVATLEAAASDVESWSFLPAPSPLAFWKRRQAHETAVHRVDAELSTGGPVTPFDPAFAADGIDELLLGFLGRRASSKRQATESAATEPTTLLVAPKDIDALWQVSIAGGEVTTGRASGSVASADCTAEGTASDLYLLLWNRLSPEGVALTGDASVLDVFKDTIRVRWG